MPRQTERSDPRRAAVLGSPIAHSLSPALHRAAYAALGLHWTYEARECDEDRLPAVLAEVRADPAWAGLSITMPCKLGAVALVDRLAPLAQRVGAVNTVVRAGDGTLSGHNTDAAGVTAALAEVRTPAWPPLGRVVVLGAGGSARAVLAALAPSVRQPGADVVVAVRDAARVAPLLALAEALGLSARAEPLAPGVLDGADLVISTVPAGAADLLAVAPWPGRTPLVDLLYHPWPTPLAQAAQRAGAPVAGGLAVLVGQAVRQVELMTGRHVPAAVLRRAAEEAVGHRAG